MSHNVRHRVRTHFNGSMKSARRQAFLRDIHRIEAESTGSVLMARLIEDELILASVLNAFHETLDSIGELL